MVFRHRSSSEPESNLEPSMASTLSAKSQQPLHNFPLPELKWGINNPSSSNHHFRSRNKLAESTHKSDDELDYPLRDLSPDDRSQVMQSAASDCSIERSLSVEKQKSAANEEKVKILLRIRTKGKSPDEAGEEEAGGGQIKVAAAASAAASGGEAEEPAPKMWNLRPRKPASKPFSEGSSLRIGEAPPQEVKTQMPGRPEFSRSRAVAAEAKTAEKKQKFSISLSKEEIEEDIFMLTGSKPARRPKKRPRIIQKQLDNLFPGLWLPFINPDSYRVPDTPAKG